MKYNLIFLPEATGEIEEAIAWYENQRRGLGQQLRDALDDSFKKIQIHPRLYAQARRDARRMALRKFPYLIYFLLEPREIIILAVFHTKRDPGELLARW